MTRLSSYSANTHHNKSAGSFKVALIIIGFFITGCSTTMQMVVPSDISAATDVIPATQRSGWSGSMANETFTLGEYKVSEVDRDWDSSESDTISINKLALTSGNTAGAYDYQFKTPNGLMKGECASGASEESLGVSGFKVEKKAFSLNCACRDNKGEVAKVSVRAKNMDNYTGTLTIQDKHYQVVSLKEVEGALSSGASGYRVDGDHPVGAVEVLKPGRIWLGKNLKQSEKSALACTFVGLMLYLPPQ